MELQLLKKSLIAITEEEKHAIFQVLSQHYMDPSDLLEREYKKNNQVYLVWIDQQLAGLFMVGYHEQFPLSPYTTDVFLGISGTDYKFKGRRIGKLLYLSYLLDAADYEAKENKRILHWWTTASPLVYLAIHKLFASLCPTKEDRFPEYALDYLHYIKDTYHYHGQPGNHPDYVLRAIAHNTRYKIGQEDYLAKIYEQTDLPVLQRNAINEQNGDRILVLCETPENERLQKLENDRQVLLQQFNHHVVQ